MRKVRASRTFSTKHELRSSDNDLESPTDKPSPQVEEAAEIYRAQIEAIKQRPYFPKIGDKNESGIEYTEDGLEWEAHEEWEMEKMWDFDHEGLQLKREVSCHLREQPFMHGSHLLEKHRSPLESDASESKVNEINEVEAEIPKDDNVPPETEIRNPVEAMRDSDGSVEEVVREARQLHGEYLPEGVLSENESKTYRRLYGEPLERVADEDTTADAEDIRQRHELLDQDGEAVAYEERKRDNRTPISEVQLDNTESLEQRAREVAELIGGEIRPYDMEEALSEEAAEKVHPLTVAGRFQTSPRTIFLPQDSFVQPVQKILSEHSNKHVKEMAERLFGGKGLPDSPLTPRIGRILPQKPIPLDASQHGMGMMEANAYISAVWPSTYAAVTSVLVETRKRLGSNWLRELFAKEGGPSVLDAGGGGVGVMAWRDIITAEWETLHSSDPSPPPAPLGKSTVLTGADNLRHRAATLLENTTFLPRLPDYVHVRDSTTLSDDRPATQRKKFDVIIAPHTLWSLGEEWQRKQHVQNFWSLLNPDGGVLILIEKGVPRGFEVIAGARELLLGRYIATPDSPTYESELESSNEDGTVQKGKGMIIAPCTNHAPCPMYPVPGVSQGRKDYCSFQQRYIRPPFLQRVLGAKDRNHDDVDFSYIAVQKGRDLQDTSNHQEPVVQGGEATNSAFEGYEDEETDQVNSLTLPRVVFPPLKRPGHVTIDLCTPAGKIDRWTITKSFSKTAYRDARKASWGDLWALGAKTRVRRNLQLGGDGSKKAKSEKERMMGKARSILDRMEEEKQADREIESEMERAAAEDEKEILGEGDDFDEDAADVLEEIEMERKERQRQGQGEADVQLRQKKKIAEEVVVDDGGATKSEPQRPQPTQSSSRPSQPQPSNPEFLSPQDLASLADFAAESRADAKQAEALAKLSGHSAKLRLRRGENKFKEPGKEAWREGVERGKRDRRRQKGRR